ncbi:MAG: molybdopterin-dependent oxidoreductase, partial [Candidatus Marinimicrobia bacterium]|nr:molybdopterin-dependent oxidoreductase [Candidatus Neomarinimicrobiota bacterium]
PARVASIHDVEQSDAVLVLGEDLTNTAPVLDLAVKQATRNQPMEAAEQYGIDDWHDAAVREWVQDKKGPLFIATPGQTRLDRYAQKTYNATPNDIARLGFAVAAALNEEAPSVELSGDMQELVNEIAGALRDAKNPVIISGTSLQSESVVQAAANVAYALSTPEKPAEICYTVPEANSLGLGILDAANLSGAMQSVKDGAAETVVILENDLYRRASRSGVDELFEAAVNVVVIDHLENETTEKAQFILPTATFAEGDGTLVNNEARAQRFFQSFIQENTSIQESWRWVRDILIQDGQDDFRSWKSLDDVFGAICKNIEFFTGKEGMAPDSNFRMNDQKIPRSTHRYTGRTAIKANVNIHEQQPPEDPDSPLSYSMEGFTGKQPSSLISYFWSPGWNSVQSTSKYQQEVGGELRGGDPGVRLIEPKPNVMTKYFDTIPDAFESKSDEWFVLPLYHIFGSDETSAVSEGLSQRIPNPYIALNPSDAEKLNLSMDEKVQFSRDGREYKITLKIHDKLPAGVAGLPVGLSDLVGIELPFWTSLSGASE